MSLPCGHQPKKFIVLDERISAVDSETRPGLNPRRLMRLMRAAINRCSLDLENLTVLTEAASGPYVVTPVIAAMAGAKVFALTGANAYASVDEILRTTTRLAELSGVMGQIEFIHSKDADYVGAADIVTNSGQVRPIDAETVSQMKPSAVVPLMYESWEYRQSDVDLEACRARNIPVAGTNEQHSDVDVFSFLGPMAMKQVLDAGVAVFGSRIVLLCDNPFAPFIKRYLERGGADVIHARRLRPDLLAPHCDVVLLAMRPKTAVAFTSADAALLRKEAPGAVLVQYWGDVDRPALVAAGVPVWPPQAPATGHMGILPSAIGPEPVIRLQTGGLKVGELLTRDIDKVSPEDLLIIQTL